MAIGQTGARFRSIPGRWGGFGAKLRSTFTTAMAGTNNDIKFSSSFEKRGVVGNGIRVQLLVAGASTPLTVTVSGTDITVNVATSAGSAATSTAAQVIAAVNAHAVASTLVLAENAPANDGTGVVTAQAFVTLVGGTDWTIGTAGSGVSVGRH